MQYTLVGHIDIGRCVIWAWLFCRGKWNNITTIRDLKLIPGFDCVAHFANV